jgi:hypothetical protein
MLFFTLLSSLSFVYLLYKYTTKYTSCNSYTTNNFNYVFYKKNCIQSFIYYWITYITGNSNSTDSLKRNVLYNSKAVSDVNKFVVPQDLKGNVISFNVYFNKTTIETILKTSNKFVLCYNSNDCQQQYIDMIKDLKLQYNNFIPLNFNKHKNNEYSTHFYELLKYYNYNQKLSLIEFINTHNLQPDVLKNLFPKNCRLSHLTKFNNSKSIFQLFMLTSAKSICNEKNIKISKVCNKLYLKSINKNYFTSDTPTTTQNPQTPTTQTTTDTQNNTTQNTNECNEHSEYKIGFINNGFYKSEIAEYILQTFDVDIAIVWNYFIINNIPTISCSIRTTNNVNIKDIINSKLFIEGNGYDGIGGAISSSTKWNELNNFVNVNL